MYLLFFIVFTSVAFEFSNCRNSGQTAQVSLSKILAAVPLNHDVDQRSDCSKAAWGWLFSDCDVRLAAVANLRISLSWERQIKRLNCGIVKCDLLKIKKRNEGNAVSLEMKQLLATMPQVGKVEWIGVRPGRREPLDVLPSVDVSLEGLVGDRYRGKAGGPRMVTLIQQEHIATVASILNIEAIDPGLLRRNLVVSGINLQALKKRRIQIGGAILEVTGNCPPCSRMEENLGSGGYNAMRGHGGITATVIQGGTINCDDSVKCLTEATNEQ